MPQQCFLAGVRSSTGTTTAFALVKMYSQSMLGTISLPIEGFVATSKRTLILLPPTAVDDVVVSL